MGPPVKEDVMPEILDGHNVYNFIDPDILLRLEELEREEGAMQGLEADNDFEMDGAELTTERKSILAEIRKKKSSLIQQHRIKKSTAESRPTVPRKFDKDRNTYSLASAQLEKHKGVRETHAEKSTLGDSYTKSTGMDEVAALQMHLTNSVIHVIFDNICCLDLSSCMSKQLILYDF